MIETLPAELLGLPQPQVAVLAADSNSTYAAILRAGLEAANRGAC